MIFYTAFRSWEMGSQGATDGLNWSELCHEKKMRTCSLLCVWCTFLAVCASWLTEAAVIYVSPDGADSNNGSTAELPLLSPTAAIESANDGDEIRFAPGVYRFTRMATNKVNNLTLTGTAARDVIFDGGGSTRILGVAITKPVTNTVIYGITFRNAHETGDGGWAVMKSCGGAVRLVSQGYPENTMSCVTNCAFENCINDLGAGAGLYVGGGSVVSDTTFTGCRAGMSGRDNSPSSNMGGALYANTGKGNVEIVRCAFTDNIGSNGVGAVGSGTWQMDGCTNAFGLVIRDCGFTNNVSYGYAGCIGIKAREVSGCTFTGNVSKNSAAPGVGNGGAVWSPEPNVAADAELAPVCFSGCRFICNTNEASNGGGVFRNIGAVLVKAERCTFIGNASVNYGNVYNFGSGSAGAHGGLVMTDCVVSGNVSVVSGAGDEYNRFGTIMSGADSGTFSLMRCRFIENVDVGGAGAVFVATPFAKVENCEFRSNRSMRCGFSAATLAFEPTASNAIVRGCLFADNTTEGKNAGVAVRFAPFNLGVSPYGGGTNCVVESCTFVGNRALQPSSTPDAKFAGAVNVGENGGTSVIRNCVFSGNGLMVDNESSMRSFSTVASCADAASHCWEDGAQLTDGVNGNIVANGASPRFASVTAVDYSPRNSSPFVNRGAFMPWMDGATDMAGNSRIVGDAVDMGCYECQLYGSFTISVR